MFFAIALLVSASITLLGMVFIPLVAERLSGWRKKKEKFIEKELDKTFQYNKTPKEIMRLYFVLPFLLGIAGYIISRSLSVLFIGVVLGLFIPNMTLRLRDGRRRQKFNNQLLDSIMILSSCLKGGLSLLQSLEVLIEEVPVPMSQEMGLVVRENKMGIPLEQSLIHLNDRMESEELRLVINSILVARETGGDLTKVLSRLSTTIRDNRKLKDSIKTLTLQGRLQGIIMSFLPFAFIAWVLMFNREHFDIMLNSDTGRMLIFIAVILQTVGMFLIKKFSAIRI